VAGGSEPGGGEPVWYRPLLAALLLLVLALALANARSFPPGGGYDASDHIAYADGIVHGHLPSQVGGSEYYSPPLFYAVAGSLTWIGEQVGLGEPHRLVLAFNVVVQLATALLLLALARELWPGRHVLHVAAVGYFAVLPVTTKLAAMFHPEPLDLLLVTAGLYLCARMLRRRSFGAREAVALGVVLGLALLVRQFALYGVGAAGLALLLGRHYRALAVTALATAVVAGPWYVRQAVEYSSPVGFAETPTVQKPIYERRPASFYVDPGFPSVLTAPWRPHYVNRAIPTTYTELWGDYFGVWRWKGTPETLTAAVKRDLRIQSLVGLLPTLLAVGGLVALLRRRQWLVAAVPLLGLVGYAYFTVGYPTPDGDVLKASYMLTTATAWALCFAYAVDRLARRQWLAWALGVLLVAGALVELPFLVY
jgi:hypothetical protein